MAERNLGLFGATSVGVGAIVGGGILALAGVAFSVAGPSAILAFALNGVIALLTAISFAELSAAYPNSGGSYAFSKRVLNVHTAFIVGWIVWFASLVAGVLYALGFAIYAVIVVEQLWSYFGTTPEWAIGLWAQRTIAIAVCLIYAYNLLKPSKGGGDFATYGKIIVFIIIILFGFFALLQSPAEAVTASLNPFFAGGLNGLFQAMGFTFIALQGFDLIAAVAGEVKEPARNLPRSMVISLVIALIIYLPLLLVTSTVGLPSGQNIMSLGAANPEAVIAITAQQFMGRAGYWLVVIAALLSMLSALQANLFAASRIAQTMAKDRTLPRQLAKVSKHNIPTMSIVVSTLTIIVVLLIVPDLAAAGAAASLIFLISFALVHLMSILARQRSERSTLPFSSPAYPLVPILGGAACLILAIFQGFVVPSAGKITLIWVLIGLLIYIIWLSQRAVSADAAAEALDPSLLRLRGRSPLVLVPLASAENTPALATIANALTPRGVGRVLFLTVADKENPELERINKDQQVLAEALSISAGLGLYPEAITTLANDPWVEMVRVVKTHRCESVLLSLTHLDSDIQQRIATLLASLDCDVTILYIPEHWQLDKLEQILVPVAGGSQHDTLRTRLLASLGRVTRRNVTFLRVLAEDVSDASVHRAKRALAHYAEEEVWGTVNAKVVKSNTASDIITEQLAAQDLIILGSERSGRSRKGLGAFAINIIENAPCAVAIISHKIK